MHQGIVANRIEENSIIHPCVKSILRNRLEGVEAPAQSPRCSRGRAALRCVDRGSARSSWSGTWRGSGALWCNSVGVLARLGGARSGADEIVVFGFWLGLEELAERGTGEVLDGLEELEHCGGWWWWCLVVVWRSVVDRCGSLVWIFKMLLLWRLLWLLMRDYGCWIFQQNIYLSVTMFAMAKTLLIRGISAGVIRVPAAYPALGPPSKSAGHQATKFLRLADAGGFQALTFPKFVDLQGGWRSCRSASSHSTKAEQTFPTASLAP